MDWTMTNVRILRTGGSFPNFHASTILVQADGANTVYDPGFPGDLNIIKQELQEGGLSLDDIHYVINSHHHLDHCANNQFFKNAKIVLHKEEYNYIKQAIKKRMNFSQINESLINFYKLRKSQSRALANIIFQNMHIWEDILNRSNQLVVIENNQELFPGVELIITPGHTMGHLSVYIDKKVCLAGDALVTKQMYQEEEDIETLLTMDVGVFLESKKSIELSGCQIIVPGHDKPFETVNGDYIEHNVNLLSLC